MRDGDVRVMTCVGFCLFVERKVMNVRMCVARLICVDERYVLCEEVCSELDVCR